MDPSWCPEPKASHGSTLIWADREAPDPSINGIGAPTVGVGPRNGTMAHFEILEFNNKNSATNGGL